MADWRERGYVPDSDEEDDSFGQEPFPAVARQDGSGDENQSTGSEPHLLRDVEAGAIETTKAPQSSLILGTTLQSSSLHSAHDDSGLSTATANLGPQQPALADGDESTPKNELSVTEQIQAALRRGLDLCEEVKSSPPLPPPSQAGTDSPLSSPPESLQSTPHRSAQHQPSPQPDTAPEDAVDQVPASTIQPQSTQAARTFRTRTAVQLQPYTLDVAKHRTEWQSRGLRPVHMRESTPGQHQGPGRGEEESQGDETFASSQPASSPPRSTLRRLAPTLDTFDPQTFDHDQQAMDIDQEDEVRTDDELPDIKDIFFNSSRRTDQAARDGPPARRQKSTTKRSVPSVEISNRRFMDAAVVPVTEHDSHANSIFDLPPSPPRSGSEPPVGLVSTSVTPRRPPTPLVSSDKVTAKRNFVEISSSPDQEESLGGADEQSSSEESSSEDPQNLMQIRRRIRGVLPASWLRIDAKQQKSKPDKHRPSRSPEKRPGKGVARHISPPPSSRSTIHRPLLDFSSSDEEESLSSQQKVETKARTATLRALFDSDQQDTNMDDVVEDDVIDRMVPVGSRRPAMGKSRKKQQQRLDHSWGVGTLDRRKPEDRSVATLRSTHAESSRLVVPKSKRTKKKSRPAQLSILDAPGLMRLDHQKQPTFLRVAARSKVPGQRARLQDPRQKFFQLATREDTAEVNEELSSWRRGRSIHKTRKSRTKTASNLGDQDHPRQPPSSAARRQEHVHSADVLGGNNQINKAASSSALRLLKDSTDATLARLQHRSVAANRMPSDATSPAIQPTLTATAKRNLGFVSWHGNRAGRGSFWNRVLSGPTQLETTVPASSSHAPVRRLALSSQTPKAQAKNQTASLPAVRPSVAVPSRPKKPSAPRRTTDRAKMDTHKPAHNLMGLDASDMNKLSLVDQDEDMHSVAVNLAISRSPTQVCPPGISRLHLSLFVSGGRLATIVESAEMPMPASETVNTALEMPNSERELHCTDYNPQVMAFIQEVMDEAMKTVSQNKSQSHVDNALNCVETIIQYTERGTRGSEDPKRGVFVVDMAQCLEAALTFLSSQTSRGVDASHILHLMSLVMLLAYQIYVGSRDLTTDIRAAASSVFDRASQITLELVLDIAGLKKLAEVPTAWDNISFDKTTLAYLESFLFWFHLTQATSSDNLESDLRRASTKLYGNSAECSLAVIMILLPLLYSFSFIDRSAVVNSEVVVPFSPWAIIVPALRDFLDAFAKQERHKLQDESLGLLCLRCCLSLAVDCGFPVSDALLQLLFKHYGKNEMLELFIAPNVSAAVKRVSGRASPGAGVSLTDFELFLRLVAQSLEQKSLSLDDASTANATKGKIVGLVFSLTPNKSRVVNEQDQLENHVLQTMANTYALYATLYSSAPRGCRPRVAQIENLLDFSTSHAQVRDLTIAAWARMSCTAVTKGADPNELQTLAMIGQNMWRALASKITTGLDADTLSKSYFQYDLDFANCQPVMTQLCTIIKHWNTVVDSSPRSSDNVGGIVSTSIISDMRQLLHFLQDHFEKVESFRAESYRKFITTYRQHDMDVSVLKLLYSVFRRSSAHLQLEIFNAARDVVSLVLSSSEDSSPRLENLVHLWFDIAEAQVQGVRDRWNQYLEDGAMLSFRLLADTKISQQCEALFLSDIVEKAPAYFELDPEGVYSRWLKFILKPQADLRFEHLLTARVISRNPTSLPLHHIGPWIDYVDENGAFSLETFIHYRADIVKHVIRCIYDLRFPPPDDSQDLIVELVDEDSGRRLFEEMTDALKSNWLRCQSTGGDPAYTKFVQTVVQELEIYPFPGFQLSTWFTDAQNSEFAVAEDRFKLLFTRAPGSFPQELGGAFAMRFRQDNQKASNTPYQEEWVQKMVAALSCNSIADNVDSEGNSIMDGHLQVQFMQNILSVYIQFAFSKGPRLAVWAVPVVQILISVIKDMHLRQDVQQEYGHTEFAAMCLELLVRVRQALDSLVYFSALKPLRAGHGMMLAVKLIELATCCISRIHEACRVQPESEAIQALRLPMDEMAMSIHACITDPGFDPRPDVDQSGDVAAANDMQYRPTVPFVPAPSLPGTNNDARNATHIDVHQALGSGRQPSGLAENWSFWYQATNKNESYTGWEEVLAGAGGATAALAEAVKAFCRVAVAAGACDDDGGVGWRQWENLALFGARVRPPVSEEEIEEAVVAEFWEE